MHEHRGGQAADPCKDRLRRPRCPGDSPRQGVATHGSEDGVSEGTEESSGQERLPQAADAVVECAQVVADVLTPGEAEPDESAEYCALGGASKQAPRRENQDDHADCLGDFLDDRPRHDRGHELGRRFVQPACLNGRVNDSVAEAGDDQRAARSPCESRDPGQGAGTQAREPCEEDQAHDRAQA